jgi:hypothetical protein
MELVARLAACSFVLALGCARCPEPAAPAGASGTPAIEPSGGPPASPGAASESSSPGASPDAPATPTAAPGEPSPAPPAGAESLPEVTVQNVGLHIGGSANDDAAKAPYKRAIEPHFDAFRSCYVEVEEPGKGGTFGVDLFIGRDGGKPEVRQPRTGIKGQKFRECMVQAFEAIAFEKPKAPTVISYSVRFAVGGR